MKRCNICAHNLNEKGNCMNNTCPAYIKAQIEDAAKESAKNADSQGR